MSEELRELTLVADLICDNNSVGCIDKTFFLVSSGAQPEAPVKGLDETLTEFLQELDAKIAERKLRVKNKDDFYKKAHMSLILLFVKPDGVSAKLKIPVEPLESIEHEEGEHGEPADSE